MSRRIVIYSTIGENYKEIQSNASTWGSLTEEFSAQGINWKGMKAVNGEDQHTYDSSEAILPDGEFSLFLMADKVKSGYDDDMDLVDEFDGISWKDESWENDYNSPEDFSFRTREDLMMARAKKASHYLNIVMNFISGEKANSPKKESSLVNTMREQAEVLKRNLGNI